MKTGTITLQGKQYITALSTRVMVHIQDRSGRTVTEELQHIIDDTDIKDLFWFINEMLVAGDVYATKEHIEHNTPPSFDDLLDLVGVDEYSTMFNSLAETIKNGMSADLEAQSKNAVTTQSGQND